MGFLPIGKRRFALDPVDDGRLIAPAGQILHRCQMWTACHEGLHRRLVFPGTAGPEGFFRVIQQAHSEASCAGSGLAGRPNGIENERGKV